MTVLPPAARQEESLLKGDGLGWLVSALAWPPAQEAGSHRTGAGAGPAPGCLPVSRGCGSGQTQLRLLLCVLSKAASGNRVE